MGVARGVVIKNPPFANSRMHAANYCRWMVLLVGVGARESWQGFVLAERELVQLVLDPEARSEESATPC